MNVKSHVELIQNFIDELPNKNTTNQTKTIPNPEQGLDIRFKDIDYTHDGAKEQLFKKLNVRMKKGEKIAILGGIGSGKSSCMKLLVGLQSFQGGNIFINEVPITEIDVDDLRKNIIYIPQHPKLFNRTLRENLTYGLPPEITAEDILKFMKENGFIELEEIFRKRMDEKVGKGGQNFSGGQKGTIWFLRAAMQKANVIIADEPTSALDPQSKLQIKKMIDIIAKKKAVIVITHDDDMTVGMDRIITFDKGKIISDVKPGQRQSDNSNQTKNTKNNNNPYSYRY
jgi:ATP-binding cassette subfamily C protein LapB